jgi:DNA-binding GntR family transcriptional regulator
MSTPARRKGPAGKGQPGDSSLTERAYRALEELIVTLQLPPGAVVSEAALSQRTGIGRTPIREALQRLAREHLMVVLPRRGILVAEVDVRRQLLLLEVRRELERLIARSAAKRATDAERKRFAEIAQEMEAAAARGDDIAFMRLDREFNRLTSEAAHNEFAETAMAPLHAVSRRFYYIHYQQVGDLEAPARLHADVARAIAEGDREKAGQASDRLLDYIESFTRATVEPDPNPAGRETTR